MITVRDLGWKYAPLTDGGKPVESLKRVSFDIRSGSFVGIIGPTGAGKSTLCMALAGIIPNLADGTMSGVVEVNGMNTSRHSVSALSERVGYVQQDPEAQLFCSSVEDEIAFPLENRGVAPSIIDKQIDIMLDLVGMAGYRKRVPTSSRRNPMCLFLTNPPRPSTPKASRKCSTCSTAFARPVP